MMAAQSGDTAFYIDDFSDEVMPCEPNLEGWANWLAGVGIDQPDFAVSDGDKFESQYNLKFVDDVVATCDHVGNWTLSRAPTGVAFMACRFGEGLGWSPDQIIDFDSDPRAALIGWLDDNSADCDDVEYIACAERLPPAVLTYRGDPPRLEVEWGSRA